MTESGTLIKQPGSGGRRFVVWAVYTAVFLVAFFVVFSLFFFKGKLFLWSTDGISQQYPLILYTKVWLKNFLEGLLRGEFRFTQFELRVGFGGDVFGNSMNYRIVNYLSAFFHGSNLETYFTVRGLICLYASGLAFIAFARKRTRNVFSLVTGALVYVFSAYSIFFAPRHAFFIDMMILFPLLCLGVDTIFAKGRSVLFTITVWLAGIDYFYFLYIITVGAVVYAAFKFFLEIPSRKDNGRRFGRLLLCFAVHYLLGVCMAAFSLLPALYSAMQSSRIAGQQGLSLLYWGKEYYREYILGQFSSQQIGLYGYVSLYAVSVLGIVGCIGKKNREKKLCLSQIIVCYIVFLVPLLVMLFSGFAGKTQRWSFIFQFWVSVSVVYGVETLFFRKERISLAGKILLAAACILYIATAVISRGTVIIGLAFLLVTFCVYGFFRGRGGLPKRLGACLLIVLIIGEGYVKADEIYNTGDSPYIDSFIDAGSLQAAGDDTLAVELNPYNEDGYRVDAVYQKGAVSGAELNYGLRNFVNGVSSYYSLVNGDLIENAIELGNVDLNTPLLISGLGQRTALNTLSSVKYLATVSGARVPYGYVQIGTAEKEYLSGELAEAEIYENQYALPLLYAYDSYIPRQDYDDLRCSEKEQAMMQGVVLEDRTDFAETDLAFDSEELYSFSEFMECIARQADGEACEVYPDRIVIREKTVFELPLSENTEGEIQVIFEDFRYEGQIFESDDSGKKVPNGATVSASLKGHKKDGDSCVLLNSTNQYYFGSRDILLDLGWQKTKNAVLTITFTQTGTYYFSRADVYAEPLEIYRQNAEKLQQNAAGDVVVSGNTITGEISCDGERYVCAAVPYSSGWTVTVDGEKTELVQANVCYMAFRVGPGQHSIVMQYRSPGLYPGVAISAAAVIAGVLLLIAAKRKERKKGKRHEGI